MFMHFLFFPFQSYRSTISEEVFFTGTPHTTNKNTVSKLYTVFIGRFSERVLNSYSEITCVRSDIMNSLIFVGHQMSSFSLILTNDDCWWKLGKKKTTNKMMWTETNIQLLGLCYFQKYIYIEPHLALFIIAGS